MGQRAGMSPELLRPWIYTFSVKATLHVRSLMGISAVVALAFISSASGAGQNSPLLRRSGALMSPQLSSDVPPKVRAYPTTVKRRQTAKLRFYIHDDSGSAFVAGGVFDAFSRGLFGWPGRTLSNGYHFFR